MSAQKKLSSLFAGALLVTGLVTSTSRAETAATTHQSTETVRMTVGHSFVLDTTVPLRRVFVGNPLVLLSYTASANELVLTGRKVGSSSLMLWDSNGSSKLYTVEVSLDPTAIEDALKAEYPNETISANVFEDHIALYGNVSKKEVADGALDLAKTFTKAVVSALQVTGHPREVKLKVRFVEVDRTKLSQFGVDLLSLGLKQTIGQTGTQQFTSSSISSVQSGAGSSVTAAVGNPLNFFLYNLKNNIGLSVADLAQQNVLQILAEPTLTAMSGQPASFLSGGEFPFPTVQASAGSTPVVTISFRPYGIKLDFTPTVRQDGTINLKVAPEVSSLDYSNAVDISGYQIPALATRRSETQVELKDGQSFAISGLLDHQTQIALAKTPGIADIPILGALFKSKNNTHSVTELVIICTAELVDPQDTSTPAEPKMSLPNLDSTSFDQLINKNRMINPNTNSDTGKAATPVAPQNQATTAPVAVAATMQPTAPVKDAAPASTQAPPTVAGQQAISSSPSGIGSSGTAAAGPASTPVATTTATALNSSSTPAGPVNSASLANAQPAEPAPKPMRLKIKNLNNQQ